MVLSWRGRYVVRYGHGQSEANQMLRTKTQKKPLSVVWQTRTPSHGSIAQILHDRSGPLRENSRAWNLERIALKLQ